MHPQPVVLAKAGWALLMDRDEYERLGRMRPPPSGPPPDPEKERLYNIYARWSGQLHAWVLSQLGAHIDCEFIPNEWLFKIYSGEAQVSVSNSGVPSLGRPPGERCETVILLRPDELPSDDDLDYLFRTLCIAAARVLKIDLNRKKLAGGLDTKRVRTLPPSDKR